MEKCSDCKQLHERSSKRCRTCVDKENARQKKQYQERLVNGMCPRCGRQSADDNKHCYKCAARVREKDRKMRTIRSAKGMCAQCGHNSVPKGKRTCDNCLSNLLENTKTRAKRLDQLGVCVRCGQFPQLPGVTRRGNSYTTCQTCYLKHISQSNLGTRKHYVALLNKLKDQDYKCPYTGERLILGDNVWLDHIMPRSRFPELAKNIDNVEWVTETVNRMKQDRTPDEFLSLVNEIHNHCEL